MFEAISQGKETVVCQSGQKDQVNPVSQMYLFPVCMKGKPKPVAGTKTQVYLSCNQEANDHLLHTWFTELETKGFFLM